MLNTLRKWPYFKFYPNDWLTSNTILLMTPPQVGSYITLLCRAWTEETCTLPVDPAALRKLGKWDGAEEDFLPVLACFPLLKNQKRRYNPRLYKERQEAIGYREKQSAGGRKGMEARWARKSGVRQSRTTPPTPPKDWLAELRAHPLYAHVDWDRELKKMDVWKADPKHTHRKINRQFIVNWVNKIEAPLSNGAVSLTCPQHPTLTFPDAQALKLHNFDYHPQFRG